MSLIALLLAAAIQPSPKIAAPAALPTAVAKYVSEIDADCRDAGGKPGPSPKLITRLDLTGDGVTDEIVDLAYYNCEGAASALSAGQSGSKVSLFVGAAGGQARLVYSALTPSLQLVTTAGKPSLHIAVMGAECGQKNADKLAMADVEVCLRPLAWSPSNKTFVLGSLSQKRPFSVN